MLAMGGHKTQVSCDACFVPHASEEETEKINNKKTSRSFDPPPTMTAVQKIHCYPKLAAVNWTPKNRFQQCTSTAPVPLQAQLENLVKIARRLSSKKQNVEDMSTY